MRHLISSLNLPSSFKAYYDRFDDTLATSTGPLADAFNARSEAATRRDSLAESITRARHIVASAAAEAERHAQLEADAIEAHDRAVATWIASGAEGSAPERVADDDARQARQKAAASAESAQRALAALETSHADAVAAHRAAEAAIVAKAAKTIATEVEAAIELAVQLEQASRALREYVFAASTVDELHLAIEQLERLEPKPYDGAWWSLLQFGMWAQRPPNLETGEPNFVRPIGDLRDAIITRLRDLREGKHRVQRATPEKLDELPPAA